MDNKIITLEQAIHIAQSLHTTGKNIVVAGGCFDIIHKGHIFFLQKSKEQGDRLFILLESDERIKLMKGENRPINTQEDRALILAAIQYVDYVILLPNMTSNQEYDSMISAIKPAIITTTAGDPNRMHKERQAKLLGTYVVDVTDYIEDQSTTSIAKFINKN